MRVNARLLRAAMALTNPTRSTDGSRGPICGWLVVVRERTLEVVTTDTHAITRACTVGPSSVAWEPGALVLAPAVGPDWKPLRFTQRDRLGLFDHDRTDAVTDAVIETEVDGIGEVATVTIGDRADRVPYAPAETFPIVDRFLAPAHLDVIGGCALRASHLAGVRDGAVLAAKAFESGKAGTDPYVEVVAMDGPGTPVLLDWSFDVGAISFTCRTAVMPRIR